MRKVVVLASSLFVMPVFALTDFVDGVTWYYEPFLDGGKTCARIIS